MAWICDYIYSSIWDAVTHPCPTVSGGCLCKPPLKLGLKLVIARHSYVWIRIYTHTLNSWELNRSVLINLSKRTTFVMLRWFSIVEDQCRYECHKIKCILTYWQWFLGNIGAAQWSFSRMVQEIPFIMLNIWFDNMTNVWTLFLCHHGYIRHWHWRWCQLYTSREDDCLNPSPSNSYLTICIIEAL